jgi:hypothetical protein
MSRARYFLPVALAPAVRRTTTVTTRALVPKDRRLKSQNFETHELPSELFLDRAVRRRERSTDSG